MPLAVQGEDEALGVGLPVAGDGTSLASVLSDPEDVRARVLGAMAEAFGERPPAGPDRRRGPLTSPPS